MKKLISIILASFVAITAFAAEKSIPAVMLQDDGYLFIEEDGQMNYKMSIPAGSELEVLTVKNENGVVVPELKESKRVIDKKLVACKCYHVKYNNKPYWCLTNRIGLNEKIGIIVKDTAVTFHITNGTTIFSERRPQPPPPGSAGGCSVIDAREKRIRFFGRQEEKMLVVQ